MRRSVFLAAVLGVLVCAGAVGQARTPAAVAQAAQVSVKDAEPFLGDWTLTMNGQNGPGVFALKLKSDGTKVTGEISSDQMALTPINDVTKTEKSLVLRYQFDYNGMPVDTVVTMTPGADDKMAVAFDFAGGAYQMEGTGAKKAAK